MTGSDMLAQLPPNLTQSARYVLEMAREITASGSSTQPEHILYALLQIPGSDVPQILTMMGIDSQKLLVSIRAMLRALPVTSAAPDWSTAAAQIIAHASTLAFQERTKEIATKHLFTSLLTIESSVRSLLFDHGVSLATLENIPGLQASASVQNRKSVALPKGGAIQVSGVFWGLLAATAICGYLTWTPAIPNKAFAVFLFVTFGWIVSLCLHEFGHAYTAYRFGDDSVYYRGYLTLNPLRYTDPFVSIVLPLVFLLMGGLGLPGGAVFIDRSRIKEGWRHSLISLAGPLANAIVVVFIWAAIAFVPDAIKLQHEEFWAGLTFLLVLELTAIFFNLLPLPPLDGFNILTPYLPPSMQGLVYALRQWSFFILMMLFWVDNPIMDGLWQMIGRTIVALNISDYWVWLGYNLYRFWETNF